MDTRVLDEGPQADVPEVRRLKGDGTPWRERFFQLSLWASLAVGVVFLGSLLTYVVVEAWPRLNPRQPPPRIRILETVEAVCVVDIRIGTDRLKVTR